MDIIRLVALVELAESDTDITWDQVPTAIWSCLEPAAAIMCAGFSNSKPIFEWFAHYYKPAILSRARNVTAESGDKFGANCRNLFTPSRDGTKRHYTQDQTWASQAYQAANSRPKDLILPISASCRQHAYPDDYDLGVLQRPASVCSTIQASIDTISQHTSGSRNYLTSLDECGGSHGDNHVSYQTSAGIAPDISSVNMVKHISLSHAPIDRNSEVREEEQEQQILSTPYDTCQLSLQFESNPGLKHFSMCMKALPPVPISVVEADNELEQGEGGSPKLWRLAGKSASDGERTRRKSVTSQQWFSL